MWDPEATVTGEQGVTTLLAPPSMEWGAHGKLRKPHLLSGLCWGLRNSDRPAPQLLSDGAAFTLFREPPTCAGGGCSETLHGHGESWSWGMEGTRGPDCGSPFDFISKNVISIFHFVSFHTVSLFPLISFRHILFFAVTLWEELWQWHHLPGWTQCHLQFHEASVFSSLPPPGLHQDPVLCSPLGPGRSLAHQLLWSCSWAAPSTVVFLLFLTKALLFIC